MTFAADLAALGVLHTDLLAAVTDTDVARLGDLLARRDDLIARLTVAYANAGPQDRMAWQPAVAELAVQQEALTAAFTAVRDRLAAELARASSHGVASPPESRSSGVDLKA